MTKNTWTPLQRPAFRDLAVAILSCLAVAAGCDGSVNHVFKDEGRLCVLPAASGDVNPFIESTVPVDYGPDRALDIQVVAPTCLSSSCTHDRKAECTASVAGKVITIASNASYGEGGNACTTDCRVLVAKCSTPQLPAGTYEVRHGTTTLMLTVPSTATPPCGGKGIGGS
jgi:hypothetical protein